MLDLYAGDYNITNPLKDKLPLIIEYFVKYYGEEHRESITEKLNNTTFLFLPKKDRELLPPLNYLFYNTKNKILEEMFGDSFKYNKRKLILLYDNNIHHIKGISEALKNNTLNEEQQALIKNIITILEINPLLVKLGIAKKTLREVLTKLENSYQAYEERYNNVLKQETLAEKFIQKLSFNYEQERTKKVYDATLANFARIKNCDIESLKSVPNINELVKTLTNIIEAGEENWFNPLANIDGVKEKRVELFKFLGFDYGDNYNEYLYDKNVFRLVFNNRYRIDLKDIDRDIEAKKIYDNGFYSEACDEINNLNATFYMKNSIKKLIADYTFKSSDTSAYITTYIDKTDKQLKFICVLPLSLTLCDRTLFHELSHIIDSKLLDSDGYYYDYFIGLSKYEVNIGFPGLNILSDHTMLNEVLNEIKAIEISNMFNQDGHKIGLVPNIDSYYKYAIDLLEIFLDKNKEILNSYELNHPLFKNTGIINKLSNLIDRYFDDVYVCEDAKFQIAVKYNNFDITSKEILKHLDDLNWSEEVIKLAEFYREMIELTKEFEQEKIKLQEDEQTL